MDRFSRRSRFRRRVPVWPEEPEEAVFVEEPDDDLGEELIWDEEYEEDDADDYEIEPEEAEEPVQPRRRQYAPIALAAEVDEVDDDGDYYYEDEEFLVERPLRRESRESSPVGSAGMGQTFSLLSFGLVAAGTFALLYYWGPKA